MRNDGVELDIHELMLYELWGSIATNKFPINSFREFFSLETVAVRVDYGEFVDFCCCWQEMEFRVLNCFHPFIMKSLTQYFRRISHQRSVIFEERRLSKESAETKKEKKKNGKYDNNF